MTRFSTETPQQDVLAHMDGMSKLIIAALNTAMTETKRQFHALGTPLVSGKPYDKSYFSHTVRYVAKRSLDENGLQTRIEEETEAGYRLGQAANTGIVLEIPNIFARVLKSPLDEDLPPAGSESRADFYEQRQYSIPFPPLAGEAVQEHEADDVERDHAFHLVYAWDVSADLARVYLKLVFPNDRRGKHQWQHIFSAAEMGGTGSAATNGPGLPNSPTLIATTAAAANTDLDLSPREDEQKKQVKSGATKRA